MNRDGWFFFPKNKRGFGHRLAIHWELTSRHPRIGIGVHWSEYSTYVSLDFDLLLIHVSIGLNCSEYFEWRKKMETRRVTVVFPEKNS